MTFLRKMFAPYFGGDKTEATHGVVPDVLYSVYYHDYDKGTLDTVRSAEPIDIGIDSGDGHIDDETSATEKPVIELRTRAVCTATKTSRTVDCDSDDSSDDTDFAVLSTGEMRDVASSVQVKRIESVRMIIHSPYIKHAMAAVIPEYNGETTFEPPYQILVYYLDQLASYCMNQPAGHSAEFRNTTISHVSLLFDFLEKELGAALYAEKQLNSLEKPLCTYANVWTLFKPGEVVYARKQQSNGETRWMPCVVSYPTANRSCSTASRAEVSCWMIAFYDGMPRRCAAKFVIGAFSGVQAIADLPVIPARFYPDDPSRQRGMTISAFQIQLGREYWDLLMRPAYKERRALPSATGRQHHHGQYDGDWGAMTAAGEHRRAERVIVDVRGYYEFFPSPASQPRNSRTCGRTPSRRVTDPYDFGHYGDAQMASNTPYPAYSSQADPAVPMVCRDRLPRFAPRCTCAVCAAEPQTQPGPFADFDQCNPATGVRPCNDLYYLVCTTCVPAFMLSHRTWAFVDQAELGEVHHDREAFENLVLDREVKQTVRALAGKFASSSSSSSKSSTSTPGNTEAGPDIVSPWPHDLVKNKGEGRVFLLHGSPGVGKTCTAECVAELAQRPLLTLTAGDVSTDMQPSSAESSLDYFLGLGERYGALVLLDEADVFLEARSAGSTGSTADAQRNGLVSVFLRALEYFRGVLFLTTSRVAAFDPAFTSRIHVALHYRPLTAEHRRRIWAYHLARIERDTGGHIFTLRSARAFAYDSKEMHRLRPNGREIRNVLQTAVALAEAEARKRPFVHYDRAQKSGHVGGEEAMDGGGDRMVDKDESSANRLATIHVTAGHLRAVAKMSQGFKDLILHGGEEEDADEDCDEDCAEEEEEEEEEDEHERLY